MPKAADIRTRNRIYAAIRTRNGIYDDIRTENRNAIRKTQRNARHRTT